MQTLVRDRRHTLQERAWSQLITDAEFDLASIDAEIDGLGLEGEVEAAVRGADPEQDQASGLRRMVGIPVMDVRMGEEALRAVPARTHRHSSKAATVGGTGAARVEMLKAASRAKVVAIASGKGGVGKTNIAVNTAIALAAKGIRVTLLDADLGTANADVLCGLMPAARLDHVLGPGGMAHQDGGTRSLADIAIDAPGGFKLVPGSAGIGRMADLNAMERRWLVSGLVELAAQADVVLIDAAAGVGQGVTSLLHAADLAVVITTPEPTAIADAYALIKCLVMEGERSPEDESDRIALVVNQTHAPVEAFATHARIARVAEQFLGLNVPLLGFIAQDVRVGESVRAQRPVMIAHPETEASRCISDLAGSIVNMLGVRGQGMPHVVRTGRGGRGNRGVGGVVRRLLGISTRSDHAAEKS